MPLRVSNTDVFSHDLNKMLSFEGMVVINYIKVLMCFKSLCSPALNSVQWKSMTNSLVFEALR